KVLDDRRNHLARINRQRLVDRHDAAEGEAARRDLRDVALAALLTEAARGRRREGRRREAVGQRTGEVGEEDVGVAVEHRPRVVAVLLLGVGARRRDDARGGVEGDDAARQDEVERLLLEGEQRERAGRGGG